MNIAAVLVLAGGADVPFGEVQRILETRLPRVPRLRQRLRRAPIGCGAPIWVDDPEFAIERHVSTVTLAEGPAATRQRLLDAAAHLACSPLPRDRPLWRAAWITPGDGTAAVVLVLHHVVADGLGGVAALAALSDTGRDPVPVVFPRAEPTTRALATEAWQARVRSLASSRARLRRAGAGLTELSIATGPPRLVARSALLAPCGPARLVRTASVPLAPVLDLAHRHDGTVNDVVLAAVTGALAAALSRRGERPSELVVSVPVSSRTSTTGRALGNANGVRPIRVPMRSNRLERLEAVARRSATLTAASAGAARASSAGPLGVAFRLLGRVGLMRWFIARQRLIHTFVTNVRGPAARLPLLGHDVTEVVPIAVTPGNVGIAFDVLSYAGQLGVTVVADPDLVPDLDRVAADLQQELEALLSGTRSAGSPG